MGLFAGLFIGSLFILLATVLNEHNARYLLSGYNTMSEERRKQFDIKGYLVVVKQVFYLLGILSFVILLVAYLSKLTSYALPVIIVVTIGSLPYLIVKASAFDRDRARRVWPVMLGIGISLLTLGGVGWIFGRGLQANTLSVEGSLIEISGMYGEVIDAKTVQEVMLVQELPTLTLRTNGFAMGTYLKGYFRTGDGTVVKLFINDGPPYLRIVSDHETYYWNTDVSGTKHAYELLKEIIGK